MDAECTHDGSIKHIQKFESWGWTSLQRRVLDAERTDNLTVLQVLKINQIIRVNCCNFFFIRKCVFCMFFRLFQIFYSIFKGHRGYS